MRRLAYSARRASPSLTVIGGFAMERWGYEEGGTAATLAALILMFVVLLVVLPS